MAAELRLAPEAERDLDEAYARYEPQRPGVGEEFLSCVDACIQSTVRWPETRPVAFESFRPALVRRFPYAVFYEYASNTITIHCVFHTARDPEKWRTRIY